ncbi:hypothetical protein BE15_10960 [Sorangium cellulosum]|uniref:Uncharacterized protein n=1 Tax=Sorangium cellulosum TaxID=56 RepID=A0A150QK25_SORCE|nr:hypothetical protein BE15_10960 [Sorangium cellulosum]
MYGKTRLPVTNSSSSITFLSAGAAMATRMRSSRTSTGKSLCFAAISRGRIERSPSLMQTWLRSMPGTPLCSERAFSAATSETVPLSMRFVARGTPFARASRSACSSWGWVTALCCRRMRPSGFLLASCVIPRAESEG